VCKVNAFSPRHKIFEHKFSTSFRNCTIILTADRPINLSK